MPTLTVPGSIPREYSFTRRLKKDRRLSEREAYKFQLYRFSSFWNAPPFLERIIDPIKLAAEGFYFNREENEIICSECSLGINILSNRGCEPRELHFRENPQCPVANGRITDNKPLVLQEDQDTEADETDSPVPRPENYSIEETSLSSLHHQGSSSLGGTDRAIHSPRSLEGLPPPPSYTPPNPSISHRQSHSLPGAISVPSSSSNQGQSQIPEGRIGGQSSLGADPTASQTITTVRSHSIQNGPGDPNLGSLRVGDYSVTSPPPSYTPARRREVLSDGAMSDFRTRMLREENRLETYVGKWDTYKHIVKTDDLARQGFYYHGPDDRVMCIFCNGILSHWSLGDVAETEHGRHFPTCAIVTGAETRNVPRVRRPASEGAPVVPQAAAMGRTGRPTMDGHLSGQGSVRLTRRPLTSTQDVTAGASHPEYAKQEKRFHSFDTSKGWPQQSAVTPANLAAAGFYYTGEHDNVRCFHCDGGLRNWEKDDDPWMEHARWFPKCAHLVSKKDPAFIAAVQQKLALQRQPQIVKAPELDLSSEVKVDKKDYREALGMGFTHDQIKQAAETLDDSTINMQSLTEALLAMVPVDETRETRGSSPGAASAQTNEKNAKTEESTEKNNTPKSKKKKKKKSKNSGGDGQQNLQEGAAVNAAAAAAAAAASITETAEVGMPSYVLEDEESRSLSEENRQLKEQRMCKVCMDEDVSIVFLPCGHLVCCAGCAPAMRACPICRALVRGTVRTYLS